MSDQSLPSSIADFLLLMISGLEAMSRQSILEVCLDALESTLSSNDTFFGGLDSPISSKDSDFDAAAVEMELAWYFLRFVEGAVSLMQKPVQI